jgi:flagellar FliL protein
MADQDRFLDEEEAGAQGEEAAVGKRVGFLPAIVLKVLKWVAIVVAILILVIVVVVITVNAIVGQTTAYTSVVPVSQNVEPPPESLQYFKGIGQIRGQTSDNPPANFIAEVDIGYEKGNNALTAEIADRSPRLHNIILLYLSKKSASELHLKNAEKLQEELVRELNRVMRVGKIQAVLFKELQAFTG